MESLRKMAVSFDGQISDLSWILKAFMCIWVNHICGKISQNIPMTLLENASTSSLKGKQ